MATFRFVDGITMRTIAEYVDNFPYIFPRIGESINLKNDQGATKVAWIKHYTPETTPDNKYVIVVGLLNE